MIECKWYRVGRDYEHPSGIARYLVDGNTLRIWCDGTRNRQEWRWNIMPRRKRFDGARLNKVDYEQAYEVLRHIPVDFNNFELIVIAGLSRGGAIAHILGWMLRRHDVVVSAFASKRAGDRELVRQVPMVNTAYRGDIVPWLPPWYASPTVGWLYPRRGFVKAHIGAAHLAARYRHLCTRRWLD